MQDLLHRLLVLAWFLAYMASIYLVLHIIVARFSRTPNSRVLWFFSVLTGPLTRPVRAVLPANTPEQRLRLVTLAVCVALWLGIRMVLAGMGSANPG